MRRAHRALRALSSCNQAVIHACGETELLKEVCRVMVEVGGYVMAWVGYAEKDARKSVRPVAHAGHEAGYLDHIDITWSDEPHGRGPTGAAIRTRRPAVCRDMETDPAFASWRDDALRRGFRASIVLPLISGEEVLGALSIYAAEAQAFDEEEVKLLEELAGELVFGILAARARLAHARADRELERALAYNRGLLEAAVDPLVAIGADGRISDVNVASEQATGRGRHELIGADFSEFFTEPDKARAGYRKVLQDGIVRDLPLVLRHRDGRIATVLYSASVYRDEAGEVAGVFAVVRDVTLQERAMEILRRSEEELRRAQRVARLGSWWLDSATNQVVWTEELFRMLGLDPSTRPPPYTEHHRLFTPESWQRLSTALPHTQATGAPYELELETVRPDGTHGWMLARGEPLRDAGGGIVGLRGTALDITQRKQAEQALRESEESFRTLAESMPQIVWVTRADGWNIYFNQHWVEYTGMTLEESYGHGWNIPFHPDDQHRAWEAWQQATRHGATYSLEVRLRRRDGAYRWWLVRGVPLLDATGQTVKWFGTCTDIHDLKVAEAEIRQLNAGLEQRIRERTRSLEESEERMQAVLRATATGTFETDLGTGETWWNDVEYRLLGLEPGEVAPGPATLFQYVHPDDIGVLTEKWEQAKQSGELDAEFRVVRADGQVRWLKGRGCSVGRRTGDEAGPGPAAAGRFLGVNYDVTERKLADVALRQSEEKFSRVFHNAPQLLTLTELETGRIVDVNETFVKVSGFSRAEAMGKTTVELGWIAADDRAKFLEAVRAEGGIVNRQYAVHCKDGSVKTCLMNGDVLQIAGQPLLLLHAVDLTDRLQNEAALRESEARLAAVIASMPVGIWVVDAAGKVTAKNKAADDIWRGAPLSQHPEEYGEYVAWDSGTGQRLGPDDYPLARTLRTGLPVSPVELRIRRFDGTEGVIMMSTAPLVSPGGALTGAVGINVEITERKRAEVELQRVAAELKVLNGELESFSHSVSHDLRAPLRSIDGFSRIVLEDCADRLGEEGRDNLLRVRAATQRMGDLIDDLLILSRVVRTGMRCVKLDVSALVREAISQLQQAEPARQVACTVEPGLSATADPALLRLALDNLLGNAWKFTGRIAGARIEFGAIRRDGERAFFVRDNGAGFDADYADQLFSPFRRLHTQEEFPGHGIGLATVQRVVRRHGGRIWAEGRVNEGATFYFTLPEPSHPS